MIWNQLYAPCIECNTHYIDRSDYIKRKFCAASQDNAYKYQCQCGHIEANNSDGIGFDAKIAHTKGNNRFISVQISTRSSIKPIKLQISSIPSVFTKRDNKMRKNAMISLGLCRFKSFLEGCLKFTDEKICQWMIPDSDFIYQHYLPVIEIVSIEMKFIGFTRFLISVSLLASCDYSCFEKGTLHWAVYCSKRSKISKFIQSQALKLLSNAWT